MVGMGIPHFFSLRAAERCHDRFSSNIWQILSALLGVDVDTHPEWAPKVSATTNEITKTDERCNFKLSKSEDHGKEYIDIISVTNSEFQK